MFSGKKMRRELSGALVDEKGGKAKMHGFRIGNIIHRARCSCLF
jgi:hypothetical protein